MNTPSVLRSVLCALVPLALALAGPARAQESNPPVVVHPVADVTVAANAAPTVIDLKKTFGLAGVSGKLVRMATNLGRIDLELFDDVAPRTVGNFLNYVNSRSYTNTIVHRSTTVADPGGAIIQGGETVLLGNAYQVITTFGNVGNEFGLPNTRGTIAMEKLDGQPDSATDQWFINVGDNTDARGKGKNGGYTVFGRVITGSMRTVDAIAALPTHDLSKVRANWTAIPLRAYDDSQRVAPENLVVAKITALPMVSKGKGFRGAIRVKSRGSSNPGLVTATLKARKLVLTYQPGKTGTAVVTLLARGADGSTLTHTFNVTVQ